MARKKMTKEKKKDLEKLSFIKDMCKKYDTYLTVGTMSKEQYNEEMGKLFEEVEILEKKYLGVVIDASISSR